MNHAYDLFFGPHEASQGIFLVLPEGGVMTHAEFAALSARLAHAFAASGLRPGDRLALQVAKSPVALAVYAACLRSGVVLLPLNPAYIAAEVEYFVSDADAKMLICDGDGDGDGAVALNPVAERAHAALLTLSADGTGSLADLAVGQPDSFAAVPLGPDDLAAFLYTSGTTGRSKGAMLTHRNLTSNAEVLVQAWEFTVDDVLLHALPIFHTHGLFVATNIALLAGCPMIFQPKFDIDALIAALPRATSMMGVPTFYTRLLDDPRLTRDLVGGMRLFISGSAPLLAETHAAFAERTGHAVLERYGMTETNMNTSNPYHGERRAGTVGLPLPGVEVRVCDDAGRELPDGEIGMIEVRGPNVFKGYWRMPEKTAAELRADGFFITGDLGVKSTDGYISIVGRQKDLIISGGFNIYPKEVEEALDALPGVLESAVIGVPHPDMGEAVVAVVARAKGENPDPQALLAMLADRLARFKQPRRIVVVDDLPRNAMGKVQKAALRKEYSGVFAKA